MKQNIFPNVLFPIIVQITLGIAQSIMTISP